MRYLVEGMAVTGYQRAQVWVLEHDCVGVATFVWIRVLRLLDSAGWFPQAAGLEYWEALKQSAIGI